MSVRTHYKLIAVASASALAIGTAAGAAVATGPSTATVQYSCTTSFGPATPSASYTVSEAPATMAAGQPLATTAAFTLDSGTTGLATGVLHWTSFSGTITTAPSATQAGLKLTIPKTTLGNGAGGSTNATATGKTLAGTLPGPFTFLLGNLGRVTLNGFTGTTPAGSVVFPTAGSFGQCTNTAVGGTTPLQDATPANVTTTIVKDTTTTTASATYSARKDLATGIAKVRSHFGLKPTGKVSFVLKRGTHKIAATRATLNTKAIAKAQFKGVKRPGRYTIIEKYLGNASLKASPIAKAHFTVR